MNDFDEGFAGGYLQASADIKKKISETLSSSHKDGQSIYYNYAIVRSFALQITDFIDDRNLVMMPSNKK